MSTKLITLIILVLTYILIIIFSKKKAYITIFFSLFLIFIGAIKFNEAIFYFINWNVLMIYIGTLILADLFIYSKVPMTFADNIVNKSKTAGLAIVFLCILTGIISIFVENVATVLVVAPLAFDIAKKLKISPVPILISIAVSSNLQGTATLVGDPPSMIFAGYAGLSFNDFFFYKGRPSIFFIVQAGALASIIYLLSIFRKYKNKEIQEEVVKPLTYIPFMLLIIMVFGLAVISFLEKGFTIKSGIWCMIVGTIGLFWFLLFRSKDIAQTFDIIKKLDWETIIFLIGIFVIIGAVSKVGLLDDLAKIFLNTFSKSPVLNFLIITFVSMILSGFIDNVPYIIIMLPVVEKIALANGINPFLLYSGLLVGSCLGGNITPFGASANIVSVGLLKKEGYHVNFFDFLKIGLPFTLISTAMASLVALIIFF
ncbi:MAG: SLC13 family permease [Spirochaetes bacterium]|nr:SLC13 family permease [Spirochaetota bacterium]